MPISKPHSSLGSANKGSCNKLANYLEKENVELNKLIDKNNTIKELELIESRKQSFFNHDRDGWSLVDVIESIDQNIKKLGRKDEKFFAPTISFSQKELNHLIKLVTNKKGVRDIWDLDSDELKTFSELIKSYIRKVMDNYASNFNRQSKGLKGGKDLVYFAKIEHFRKFKGTDKEVKTGIYKSGDFKTGGLQTHCHLIVSRKDITQKLKLTPTVKDRKTDRNIRGNRYRVGFDRVKWIKMNEETFDNFFKYNRGLLEMFENQRTLKNGSFKEINDLKIKIEKENRVLTKKINQSYKGNDNDLTR